MIANPEDDYISAEPAPYGMFKADRKEIERESPEKPHWLFAHLSDQEDNLK